MKSGFCSPAVAVTVFLFVLFLCQSPCAEAAPNDKWQFDLVLYGFLAGLEGDATVGGQTASIDVSFSDILEELDFTAMAHFEAKKGNWGLFLDPLYLKMSPGGSIGPVEIELDSQLLLVEFGGFYRIVGAGASSRMVLDVLGGARYWYLDTEMSIRVDPLGLAADAQADKDWIDPFIGLRFRTYLTRKLLFNIRGDIGGFDVSDNSSQFTWNVIGGFGYEITPSVTVWAGYRALGVDYEEGSGRDRFALDAVMHGPIVGVGFRF